MSGLNQWKKKDFKIPLRYSTIISTMFILF